MIDSVRNLITIEISKAISKAVKPLVGPIIHEMNSQIFENDKFFVFDVVRNTMANFVFGLGNFVYDGVASTFTSNIMDFVPGRDKLSIRE